MNFLWEEQLFRVIKTKISGAVALKWLLWVILKEGLISNNLQTYNYLAPLPEYYIDVR